MKLPKGKLLILLNSISSFINNLQLIITNNINNKYRIIKLSNKLLEKMSNKNWFSKGELIKLFIISVLPDLN